MSKIKEALTLYKYQMIGDQIQKRAFRVYRSRDCFVLFQEDVDDCVDYMKASHYGLRVPTVGDVETFDKNTEINYTRKVTYLLEDNDEKYISLLKREIAKEIAECERKLSNLKQHYNNIGIANFA